MGGRVVVGIEYPWLPIKCKKCKSFGHLSHTCTKQVWIPKRSEPVQKDLPNQYGPLAKKATKMKSTAPNVVAKDQWNVVKAAKRTPISKAPVKDSQRHWTNSFHLLARADGRYGSSEVRGSGAFSNSLQKVIENALNEKSANLLKVKGKGKMEEEEVLMRGFSPTI
jgi:hypothetical protein